MIVATDTLTHVAQELGLVAGIVVALGVIGRAALGAWRLLRRIAEVAAWIEEIYIEFKPDAGHSLHDRILRIDENVQTNARNIGTIYGVVLKGHEFDPAEAPLLENLVYEDPDDV